MFKDKAGGVVPISDELFRDAKGEYKVLKRGREVHTAQLAEAISDPDEIWIGVATVKIPQAQGGGTELVIDRKYIRTDPKTGLIAVFELLKGRWAAKTAFRPQKKNSITTDINAINKRRSGVLVYKRP
ncbi:MAG: PBECR2 nuclease fold domain-containing protein [Sulfitobacter sp.]